MSDPSIIDVLEKLGEMTRRAEKAEAERKTYIERCADLFCITQEQEAELLNAKEDKEKAEQDLEVAECLVKTWINMTKKAEAELAILRNRDVLYQQLKKVEAELDKLKAELAEARKYDRTKEDVKSLEELLEYRTNERDKYREALTRLLRCQHRGDVPCGECIEFAEKALEDKPCQHKNTSCRNDKSVCDDCGKILSDPSMV